MRRLSQLFHIYTYYLNIGMFRNLPRLKLKADTVTPVVAVLVLSRYSGQKRAVFAAFVTHGVDIENGIQIGQGQSEGGFGSFPLFIRQQPDLGLRDVA
jgi:hypothetical protein